MEKLSVHDERLIEAIEACRLGRDDMSDPVLAELLQRLAVDPGLAEHCQRLGRCDEKLTGAFRDVPVPEGLDRRLLARLEQESCENAKAVDADAATTIRPKRVGRRRLLAVGGGLAVAASLVLAATIYIYHAQPPTQSSVLDDSIAFFKVEATNPVNDGELVANGTAPEDYPFSRMVGRVPGMRWRPIADFLGHEGVAYDLPICDQATLYVVRRKVPDLPTEPPLRPQTNTGGFSAATWQRGELLYVLVLHGNRSAAAYRGLVDMPHGPLI